MKKFLFQSLFILILFPALTNAQQLSLIPSNYNGFNISCFGQKDGNIDLTITGGTPPYTIRWSNDALSEDLTDLPAGYYRVEVDDADSTTIGVETEITLIEPKMLILTTEIHQFVNGYNISLYGACNGSVVNTVTDGVPPYAYMWSDGSTQKDRISLCAGNFDFYAEDLNGCIVKSELISLLEPERGDWQMGGNSGINPSSNFIGTTDNADLVLKTQSIERMRISGTGQINLSSLSGTGNRYLQATSAGNIQAAPGIPWETHGNDNVNDQIDYIGTINSADFIIRTSDVPRVFVKSSGLVGIGVQNPIRELEVEGITRIGEITTGKFIDAGYDGNNVAIDSYGLTSGLKINYNSGEDVKILTNTSGGSLEVGHNTFLATIDGSVGIGTNTIQPGYKLVVDGGKVGFREVFVKLNGAWPDYVFSLTYNLSDLNEVESYINNYQHLPGMPSSIEILSEGQNIGEIQRLQQEKIEELYLYIIELKSQIDNLQNKVRK